MVHAARMDRAGSSPEGDADQEIVIRKNTLARTTNTRKQRKGEKKEARKSGQVEAHAC